MERQLTIRAAAARIGTSYFSLWRKVKAGKVRVTEQQTQRGKEYWIPESEVERLAKERQGK